MRRQLTIGLPATIGCALLMAAGCPSTLPIDDETPMDHSTVFTAAKAFTGTESCLECHADVGQEFLETAHWKWEGDANIVGHEGHTHGKYDLINNFCIAVPSNEARCTECHSGYGWKDANFDFTDATQVDCLSCHDNSGTYKKDPMNAGQPLAGLDMQTIAQSVGSPTRANCGSCHFYAGGGDNVKHGDLASTLVNPTPEQDVHMGGQNMSCQKCHTSTDHRIAGVYLHSVASEGRIDCIDCHDTQGLHSTSAIDLHLGAVACQTCHIPTFSRAKPTQVEWYWGDAGQDISPIPTDQYGKPTYDKKKGSFVWEQNVRPTYLWYNGKTRRYMLDSNDSTATQPVVLAAPDGDKDDPAAKIFPFKKMIGNQPGDAVNKTLIVPHLFGTIAGPNPYWKTYNWGPALEEGAAAYGQAYSGSYEFVDTVMYLTVNHEVAPKEDALSCSDCHNSATGIMDFQALGYQGNPWIYSGR